VFDLFLFLQVAELVTADDPRHTGGSLRGLADDDSGCEHVADRNGGRIVSYCPANAAEPTGFTKVKHIIWMVSSVSMNASLSIYIYIYIYILMYTHIYIYI